MPQSQSTRGEMLVQIKKGQSLIEVVVALGILAIVFSGTMTLIVQVLSLELSARNRTQAVGVAQKQMALSVAAIEKGCAKADHTASDTSTDIKYAVAANTELNLTGLGSPLGNTILNDDYDSFNYSGGELTSGDFVKINVIVWWEDRGLGQNSYELTQMLRK